MVAAERERKSQVEMKKVGGRGEVERDLVKQSEKREKLIGRAGVEEGVDFGRKDKHTKQTALPQSNPHGRPYHPFTYMYVHTCICDVHAHACPPTAELADVALSCAASYRAAHRVTCSPTILPPSPVHVDVVGLAETAELADVALWRAARHAGRHCVCHLNGATAEINHSCRL